MIPWVASHIDLNLKNALYMVLQGMGEGAFATVLTTFALSSVVVGVFFFLLGKLKVCAPSQCCCP